MCRKSSNEIGRSASCRSGVFAKKLDKANVPAEELRVVAELQDLPTMDGSPGTQWELS